MSMSGPVEVELDEGVPNELPKLSVEKPSMGAASDDITSFTWGEETHVEEVEKWAMTSVPNESYMKELDYYSSMLEHHNLAQRLRAAKELVHIGWQGGVHAQIALGAEGTLQRLFFIASDMSEPINLRLVCLQAIGTAVINHKPNQLLLMSDPSSSQVFIQLLESQNEDMRKWAAHTLLRCVFHNEEACQLLLTRVDVQVKIEAVAREDWSLWGDRNEAELLLKVLHLHPILADDDQDDEHSGGEGAGNNPIANYVRQEDRYLPRGQNANYETGVLETRKAIALE